MILKTEKVIKEWTDYNGHMNMSYYILIFDIANPDQWLPSGIISTNAFIADGVAGAPQGIPKQI